MSHAIESDGRYLHELDADLCAVSHNILIQEEVGHYKERYVTDPEHAINATLTLANTILDYTIVGDVRSTTSPHFALTRKVLRHIDDEELIGISEVDISNGACLEAELRLLRSLWLQEPHPRPREGRRDYMPAAILTDINGEPCAYQKSSGVPSAYFWRESVMRTDNGPCIVPADCFVSLNFEPGEDPRHRYSDMDLLHYERITLSSDAEFLRFSTASLRASVRLRGAVIASKRYGRLRTHLPEMRTFSAERIGERVRALILSDKALRVKRAR